MPRRDTPAIIKGFMREGLSNCNDPVTFLFPERDRKGSKQLVFFRKQTGTGQFFLAR